jgi:hypothetical protein
MWSGKDQVRHSDEVGISRSGKIWVSRLGKIGLADRVKITQVCCLGELKKKIEEASPNWNGVESKRGSRTWVWIRESQGRGKLSPSHEGSNDEEFGSIENRVGEEIKLSYSPSRIKLGVQIGKDREIESM